MADYRQGEAANGVVLRIWRGKTTIFYECGKLCRASLSDFRCREVGDTFPREPAVSPYISFLMCAFRRVSDVHRETLALEWISEAHTWPDWLLDGLSNYVASKLPYRLKAEWAIILEARVIMSNCKSLQETQRLRF